MQNIQNNSSVIVAATPQLDPRIKGREGLGLISIFTGDGRGKTTAGLGTAVRALGAGKRVAIVYFDKGGGAHYSERKVLDVLARTFPIEHHVTGRDRIDPTTGRFDFSIIEQDRTEAARGLDVVRGLFARAEHDLVVLDEVNSTISLGMLDEGEVLDVLSHKPDRMEVILTGRNAPISFRSLAHLVTDMTLVKHYFYSGVPAREGIDW